MGLKLLLPSYNRANISCVGQASLSDLAFKYCREHKYSSVCSFAFTFFYFAAEHSIRLWQNITPSVRKYKAIRAKNSENIEIRKTNLISSSTQPKEEFPCALCWDSLKLRGSRIFT